MVINFLCDNEVTPDILSVDIAGIFVPFICCLPLLTNRSSAITQAMNTVHKSGGESVLFPVQGNDGRVITLAPGGVASLSDGLIIGRFDAYLHV